MRLTLDQVKKLSLGERLMKLPRMLEGDQAGEAEKEPSDGSEEGHE
jgi:hypothetical protein